MSTNKSILVAEDDEDIRMMLSVFFKDEGFHVEAAENGKIALGKVQAAKPDVILLDLMMPEMDGMAFRAAQEADAAISAIPVILMSADASLDIKSRALPGVRSIRKPMDLDRLLELVHEAMTVA